MRSWGKLRWQYAKDSDSTFIHRACGIPEDRKIIHAALRDDPAVVTQSIGHGRDKSIVVAPASEKPKSRSRRRRKR